MSKKLLSLALFFLLSSCQNDYWRFHEQKNILLVQKAESQEETKGFSLDQIEPRDIEILMTPDRAVLDRIVGMIDEAKSRVQIETYILTEKRIIGALKDAQKRGVSVQVLLEKNVYGGTGINTKAYTELKNAGVSVAYASNKLYVYTHTKSLIIDGTYIITTGNLSYASFTTNREIYVIGKNKEDLRILTQILAADFLGQEIATSTPDLVLSPINSRIKIEALLQGSKENILIYAENFGDARILSILEQKVAKGIPVTICMGDPSKIPSNKEAIAVLKSKWIDVRTSKKPIIHAKSALVDGVYNYIGSENFSTNSLDNNREIGILTQSSSWFTETFKRSFEQDCPKKS